MGEEVITSPIETVEAFNSYFTNVCVIITAKIPSPKFTPESYLTPTDNIFSIQILFQLLVVFHKEAAWDRCYFFVYINDLPNCLNSSRPRMFADGTSISYLSDSIEQLQNVMNSELKNVKDWLITNKLSLNITKTEFMIIGSRQRVNASQDNIDIRIDDREVKRVHSTKSLGLHIDSHLTWSVQIE